MRPARQRRARRAAGHTHGPTPRSSPAPTAGLLRVGSTGQGSPVATIEAWTWRQRPSWQAMRRPTLRSDTTEGVRGPVIRRRRRSWSHMWGRPTNASCVRSKTLQRADTFSDQAGAALQVRLGSGRPRRGATSAPRWSRTHPGRPGDPRLMPTGPTQSLHEWKGSAARSWGWLGDGCDRRAFNPPRWTGRPRAHTRGVDRRSGLDR